ncbi:MAG: aminoacyl-tRNA hydrolase [Gammaproteobacteria bacterium]|nr:aminoacyl-tRNA hydrolase [Gammaproteobacteria bacterium]NNC96931.1 aminoacyl-tRNA hydrolase [Gammaproteobacteria bacterium]NNM13346.1 aminoacyl-tRNA hydrolase [Gammaproteobacteria bacterium]
MKKIPDNKPKLIVGLGNPGDEYRYTRHNVGAWFVHALARKFGASFKADRKFQGEVAEIIVKGHKLRLLFPTTYMNLSGQSVRAVADYYNIEPEEILVAHDELDLPAGHMRLKFSGGHGGHNGLRDTSQHMGKDYWRLRIGVDHPGNRKQVTNYLIHQKTPREDEEQILVGIEKVIKLLDNLLEDGYEKTMHVLHQKELSPEQLAEEEQRQARKKAKKEAWLNRKAEANQEKARDKSSPNKQIKDIGNKTAIQLALEKARHEEE